MPENSNQLMDKIVALCKRRGFIFQSSEIYGGINGFWDYGPLGVELKRNIKNAWWEDIVRKRDDMVGVDCSIIMNPKVWEASGHVVNFNDPLVDCKQCKARFRADKVFVALGYRDFVRRNAAASAEDSTPDIRQKRRQEVFANPHFVLGVEAETEEEAEKAALAGANSDTRRWLQDVDRHHLFVHRIDKLAEPGLMLPRQGVCPKCGGELTDARKFNMMFKTFIGAMEDSSSVAYLRPETAQGIFCNYKNVLDTSRLKVPFGIAQIGKAFRNEINPRNYTFRSREFEQMEIEFFCHPNEADKWYEHWRKARFDWYVGLGLTSSKLHLRDHEKEELAHYAKSCADIEYEFPFGTAELEGVANRTDFDLKAHQEKSGKDMAYFNDETKERFIPYVIEPSGGVDRAALAFLCEAYCEDEAPDEKGVMQKRVVMKLHPRLAPVKVAIFPLVKRDGMDRVAREIYQQVRASGTACFYDEKGAIGRRYRRQDEAGTPFCITVDGQTLQDGTVTIRDRDSLAQERIAAKEVLDQVTARTCLPLPPLRLPTCRRQAGVEAGGCDWQAGLSLGGQASTPNAPRDIPLTPENGPP
jgi:glycyl-tRNA synthetase